MTSAVRIPTARFSRRPLVLLCLAIATATAGLVATPANAFYEQGRTSYAGYWQGSSNSVIHCGVALRRIQVPGPYIERANAYRTSNQTIWMQVRLERFNWTSMRWETVQRSPWRMQLVGPGEYAAFVEEEFWNIGPTGHYAVSYDLRWSVSGVAIGSLIVRPHGFDYQVSNSTGFTFDHGCHI